jgi:hypothetical protein
MYKQQQTSAPTSGPVITESLPEKHKENAKQIRNPRHPPTPLTKQLGDGHFHDRQSGTGRVYVFIYAVTNLVKKEEEKAVLVMLRMSSTKTSTSKKLPKSLKLKL